MRGLDGRTDSSCKTLFAASPGPSSDQLSLDALRQCLWSISQSLRVDTHDHTRYSQYCVSGTSTWSLHGSFALSHKPKHSQLDCAYIPHVPDYAYRSRSGNTRDTSYTPCTLWTSTPDVADMSSKLAQSSDDGITNNIGESDHSDNKDKRESPEPEDEGENNAEKSAADGNDENNEDDDDDDEDEDEDEEDDGVVRCVCGERNDGELMIQCEICQAWQHTLCMGIRDEAHIPDKYYCEKCHPEDHPYINSRPRTVVLAEASSMGTSTMMRRSAVMAVAKMSAREEYRSAAAAAAIAASVASAATEKLPSNRSRNGRKTPKKQQKQSDTATTPKSARKGGRSRRQAREASEGEPDDSSNEFEAKSGSGNGSEAGSGAGNAGLDEDSVGRKPVARRRGTSIAGSRNGAQSKRSASAANGNVRGKRRKTGSQSLDTLSSPANGHMLSESAIKEEDEGSDEGEFAEDLVAQMMGAKIEIPRSRGRARTAKSRKRSASTMIKPASSNSTDGDIDTTPIRLAGAQRFDFQNDAALQRRGKSMPGSPQSQSPSSSPTLQSLLYGYGDHAQDGKTPGRSIKRKRADTNLHNSKLQRMAVSASNSPFLNGDGSFGAFGEITGSLRFASQRNSRTASNADEKDKDVNSDGTDNDEEDAEQNGHLRQPRHNFPPQEMADIDGNMFMVPSNMISSRGQPIYSSIETETMCRIRYPHSKTSMYELNRRAKQLLEWLGKTQIDYEHERKTWLDPTPSTSAVESESMQVGASNGNVAASNSNVQRNRMDRRLSDAPTSPINPSDWPEEDEYDGAQSEQPPKQQRSTLTIMEDLVWRLIQFQETYSN
ncbi:Histone deacetylase complex subunit [Coemansia sp. D1744]|nr:Histone deacetylase complex subunit [Coemansia sp. D1744]